MEGCGPALGVRGPVLLTGVRTEEAQALLWAEVDLIAGTVAVYRSVRAKGDTKTRLSRRVLKLPKQAAGLGEDWAPRELRHWFVSILSASDVPLEDISQLVGHVSTSVTETVHRHEIRPALAKGAPAMDKILKKKNKTA